MIFARKCDLPPSGINLQLPDLIALGISDTIFFFSDL